MNTISPACWPATSCAPLTVDLDFTAGRMNFFMPDHCPGKVIYWPVDTVAAVPITLDATHIVVPVTVDGHAMRATIDTGASRTTMNLTYAQSFFGLSPGSPDMAEADFHPNGDKSLTVYRHTFSSLSFEGVTVKNPTMIIMPDRINSKQNITPTGSHISSRDIALPQILIGLDILRKLHVYISYKEARALHHAAGRQGGKGPAARRYGARNAALSLDRTRRLTPPPIPGIGSS